MIKTIILKQKEPSKEPPNTLQHSPEWSVLYYQYPQNAQDHFNPNL